MCLRADGVQRSAPLSSMGPADMVPCLELSVTAHKCREKSVRKVHTSSYKRVLREIGQALVKNLGHDVLARSARTPVLSAMSALHAHRQRSHEDVFGFSSEAEIETHHPAKHSALDVSSCWRRLVDQPRKPSGFKPAVRVTHPYSELERRKTCAIPTCPAKCGPASLS